MSQLITVDRATLEQCLAATLGVVHGDAVFGKPVKEAISSLRAALANAEPAQDVTELVDCLDELCDIVEGVVEDKSSVGSLIDSFTTQPARAALSKHKGAK